MKVDRLVVLYEERRDPTGEAPSSAKVLDERQRLAGSVAVSEQAKAKSKAPIRSFVLGFSGLGEKNAKGIGNSVSKQLTAGQKDLAKLLHPDEGASGAKLTWGAYVILHGSGGVSTQNTSPEDVANLLKGVQEKIGKKGWQLKKVCVVGCTLGAKPIDPLTSQPESWVRMCCDALKVPGAMVGGYTVPVYIAYENHPASEDTFGSASLPSLKEKANWGHKLIQEKKPKAINTFDVQDVAVRLTDTSRVAYKVAWRWNDEKHSSEQVDVMKEWYHQ
ncbi:hypothetical protein SAMN04487926_101334 [Paraburkholderia steynii]|uniref:Peptidase C80 domain-containing protein n=1 Tax=Paraburkholderia steynii TaxID=1245441 RepID=A0A7Z7FFS4_9BURK|nr:hypothetical protein [Paraburkholderia steynii]SDG94623.1 hypothetical protein SAMN04487926_101334 [Paraburkholderia steynii]